MRFLQSSKYVRDVLTVLHPQPVMLNEVLQSSKYVPDVLTVLHPQSATY
jgi:hypothetical protein